MYNTEMEQSAWVLGIQASFFFFLIFPSTDLPA